MIRWRRNGTPLPFSPRVQVLANGTLLIQSFQKRKDGNDGDIGEYDCAAQNRYGMLVSRKAKVLLACKYKRPGWEGSLRFLWALLRQMSYQDAETT